MANYDIGDEVRVSVLFTDAAGVAADPTVVKFLYKYDVSATTTLVYGVDAALVKDSIGNYHVDHTLVAKGNWYWRWEGTGAVLAATEDHIIVNVSVFY